MTTTTSIANKEPSILAIFLHTPYFFIVFLVSTIYSINPPYFICDNITCHVLLYFCCLLESEIFDTADFIAESISSFV